MQKSNNKIQFVNESRRQELMKNKGFQVQNATDETRTAVGKQLGAKFMLTGALIEMQSKPENRSGVQDGTGVFFQLTIEITDLETGIIAWSTQGKVARARPKPLIGW